MIDPPNELPVHRQSAAALAVALLAAVFAGFLLLGVPAQVLHAGWGLWFTELFVFAGLPFVVLRVLGRSPGALAVAPGFTWKLAAFGFAVGLFNWAAAAVPLMAAAQTFLPHSLVEAFDGAGVFRDRSPGELFAIAAGAAVAAPLCEEYFFRGVVQPRFERALRPWGAIVLTAFIFSAFHLDPVGFAARFELGLVFGGLAVASRSIWPGVFAHAANNLASTVAFFSDPSAEDAPVEWSQVATVFVIGAVGLGVLFVLARRWPALRRVAEQVADPRGEPVPLLHVLRPWAVAAVASVGLLLAADWRGVQLNTFDLSHPLRRPSTTASQEARARWQALQAVRLQARRAEVPMQVYFDAREAAASAEPQPTKR